MIIRDLFPGTKASRARASVYIRYQRKVNIDRKAQERELIARANSYICIMYLGRQICPLQAKLLYGESRIARAS